MADATLYNAARARLGSQREALRSASQPGLYYSPVYHLNAATALLSTLGTLAANAPTEELQASWLEQYRALQPKAATLRGQVGDGMPSAVMLELSKFSEAVLSFSGKVLEGAGGVVSGIGKLFDASSLLLFVLLVIVAVFVVKMPPEALRPIGKGK